MIWLGIVLGILICGIGVLAFYYYVMKEIAQDDYTKLVGKYNEVNQKLYLYDYLLYDATDTIAMLCNIYANEPTEESFNDIITCLDKFLEIAEEYKALNDKKTTGYIYSGNKEEDTKLLEGYKLSEEYEALMTMLSKPTIEIDEDDE